MEGGVHQVPCPHTRMPPAPVNVIFICFFIFSLCSLSKKKKRTDRVHVDEPSCPLLSILVAAEAEASINFIIQVCSLQSLLCGVFTPERKKYAISITVLLLLVNYF